VEQASKYELVINLKTAALAECGHRDHAALGIALGGRAILVVSERPTIS
jgi:hypothetical protein